MEKEFAINPKDMMQSIGKKKKEAASELEKWIVEALERAGIPSGEIYAENSVIIFSMDLESSGQGRFRIQYRILTESGDGWVKLIQILHPTEQNCAENILEWYIRQKNREFAEQKKNMCYERDPRNFRFVLTDKIRVRDSRCRQLIEAAAHMNRVAVEDYEIIKLLGRGTVPAKIAERIKTEYAGYEREYKKNNEMTEK